MATAWKNSSNGKAEVIDLIQQIEKTNPDQAAKLENELEISLKEKNTAIADESKSGQINATGTANLMAQLSDAKVPLAEKKDQTQFPEDGRVPYKTTNGIRIAFFSSSLGPHQFRYRIEWRPLNRNGRGQPTWDGPNGSSQEYSTSTLSAGVPTNVSHRSPGDSQYGWKAIVSVPPQSATRGNAGDIHFNVITD